MVEYFPIYHVYKWIYYTEVIAISAKVVLIAPSSVFRANILMTVYAVGLILKCTSSAPWVHIFLDLGCISFSNLKVSYQYV